jgi:hypothetical protein
MLKRALLLCLGLWLIASAALSAHAGPCDMVKSPAQVAVPESGHAHCDMTAADADDASDPLPANQSDGPCCCPAVLAGLAAAPSPVKASARYGAPMPFPPTVSATSRTLIPEPPPPKA